MCVWLLGGVWIGWLNLLTPYTHHSELQAVTALVQFQFYVTTDGQPASLSWYKAPIWGLRPDLYNSYDNYGFFVGRPLWREDGSDLHTL
jgi:hypothetical protein